jgi:peptidoglycan/LPS O-acetylase OafA/YrhL
VEALESTVQTQRPAGSGFHGGVPLSRGRHGRGRLEGIEGLRALAATAILAFHVWDETAGVQSGASQHLFANLRAGVTLFFVLSGFLLYRPFAAAVVRGAARPSVRRYAVNRALRILPAYWAILLLDALLLDRGLLTRPLQLVANFFFAQNYVPRYQPSGHHYLGIGPAWSVVIELSFYALLPLLGLLAFAAVGRRQMRTAAALTPAAFMLVGGAAALIAYRAAPRELGDTWQKYSLPCYAVWFGAGMVLAVVRVLWEDGRLRVARRWPPLATLSGIVLILGSCKLYYSGTLLFNEYQAVVAVAFAGLMTVVVLTDERTRVLRLLEWRPLVAVGLVSYSLFLWNDPIIRWLRDHDLLRSGSGGLVVNLAVAAVLSGMASVLTYHAIEKRALAMKPKARGPGEPTDAEPLGSIEADDLHEKLTRDPET